MNTPTVTNADLKNLATTIRTLSLDAVDKANSGHPGLPLGAADFASVLWSKYLRFNPRDTRWLGRDRFILSAGHGSMLAYSLLNLFGYDLPMSELQKFRQWDSKTPGHPEFGWTPGVETTTGPLGQGFANGVGMAMSAKMMAARYGELFDTRVYGIVSDGDLMEGVAAEAASLAGFLGLNNLVYLYDDNHISLAAKTDVTFKDNTPERFAGYGWFVQSCDGHNVDEVTACMEKARAEKSRPSLICCRTTLGFGSPNKANTHDAHGAPLGAEETKLTKRNLGAPEDKFFLVSDETKKVCEQTIARNAGEFENWTAKYNTWRSANPALSAELDAQLNRTIPAALQEELLKGLVDGKKEATRNISGKAIQIIAKHVPYFVGGSADLDPSTKTFIKDGGSVKPGDFKGKNIHWGVREHAMGSAVNGLAYQQCWIPFSATFLVFADYMRPPIRLAALSHLQSLFIFTHDSFWVGEDGPTHEPIEQIQSLRMIPNLSLYRPADATEVAMCYMAALNDKKSPSTLIFSRQNLPALERPASFKPEEVLNGAYVVHAPEVTDRVIVATGSEVWVAVDAAKLLAAQGKPTRVVSMPCVERFLKLDSAKREALIPKNAKKASLEASITMGWERIVGADALLLGINHYGASAPGELLAEKFGFTPAIVAEKAGKFF